MNEYKYKLNFYIYPFYVFFFLFSFYGCSSRQNIMCAYVPQETKSNKYPELTQYTDCARINDKEEIIINDDHLDKIWFDDSGLAEIRIHDGVYYLNNQGKITKSYFYDNGADPFREGLSRTKKNNKFGFIDKKLNVVIQPKYDFVYPFSNGISKICIGCKKVKAGEHTEIQNGKWGGIDKSGNVVIDISHKYEDIEKIIIKNKEQ